MRKGSPSGESVLPSFNLKVGYPRDSKSPFQTQSIVSNHSVAKLWNEYAV